LTIVSYCQNETPILKFSYLKSLAKEIAVGKIKVKEKLTSFHCYYSSNLHEVQPH